MSRDEHTAEKVTQETFFRALSAIDRFRGDCQLRVWRCQIARNQYLIICRTQKHFAESAEEPEDDGIKEGFEHHETAKQLHTLLTA